MAKLVRLAVKAPSAGDADLAASFGYAAPFAATYRSWLHKTGIAEQRKPFRLTERGKVVYENDPAFASPITMWFLHHELTTDPERAEAWHFFVQEFLRNYPTFSKADLLNGVMMKFRAHHERHFGPESKMNPIIVRKLIECYTKPEALGDLGLISQTCNDEFQAHPVAALGPWRSSKELEKAYKA